MARLESLTKNSALIIIVIFLLVMVIVFCNREKLSSSFVYQSEISKERKLDSIEQEGEETKVSSSPVAKAQEGEESKLSSSAERSEAGDERSSATPSATAREGKVVKVDFFEYYFSKEGNPRFDGITFFEIK